MGELGNFLGWLTGLGFTLALLNFPVKWANKRWINKLPKESKFKKYYMSFMKFIIQKHRYFGLGAAGALLIHIFMQIQFKWVSTTGLIATALLVVNVLMGANLFFKHKGDRGTWFKVHRATVVLLFVAIASHVLLRL